jgi:hypothetical protein
MAIPRAVGLAPCRLLRTWIRFARDPRRCAGVDLDDREAAVLLDDRLGLGILVVERHDKSDPGTHDVAGVVNLAIEVLRRL